MKLSVLAAFVFLLLVPDSTAQFIRKWEKSAALGNLPSWFSNSNNKERGLAYSYYNNNHRLYLITDGTNPKVLILNALTGDSIGTLNTTGITGGLIALNDITGFYPVSGSKLYACNLTTNPSTNHFKIYRWENETAVPQILLIDSTSTLRLGDYLNVKKGWNNFKFILASPNSNIIIEYTSFNGEPPFTKNVVTLINGNMGNNASADFNDIYPISSDFGGYFTNSDNNRPASFTLNGIQHGVSADTTISANNNCLKYFANGTLCCDNPFYVTYNYVSNAAELVRSMGGPWEYYWGSTPSMGSNPNPQNYGDVEFTWMRSDSLLIFVHSGNNGIGAYHAVGLITSVELTSFTASLIGSKVLLSWTTAAESNNRGFEVEKNSVEKGWRQIGFVEGNGTTTEISNYCYEDKAVENGKLSYRLKQIDYDGSISYSDVVTIDNHLISEYLLQQNYPNPFNPETIIEFTLPAEGSVSLTVHNILGELVAEILSDYLTAGKHKVSWKPGSEPSGIYFYTITTADFTDTKKMLIVK